MTEYPTRRARREAEAGIRAPQHVSRHRVTAHPLSRSKLRVAVAAVATVLMAGGAFVALPADAAPAESGTMLASQLLGETQTFEVAADVSQTKPDLVTFDASVSGSADASDGATSQKSSAAITVGGVTNADWAALVLKDAGLPLTQNNLTVMLQWMDSENSPQSWWLRNNPLNNGLGSGGGGGFGSYDNLGTAAEFVAAQLQRPLFSGIASALAADSDPAITAQAIMNSAWASSHYGYGSLWHAVDVPIVAAPASAW
ncbi:hypothetical protein [Gryllotalpicola ginsengisoli]|uniref:hypothetical protein n=1 Tax=Gryllotalpicola ginsengisoli TaxID=444608 RepID=UPI0003B5AAF2|nr:hypothetical protein [Gryllotalpicola ginsengisoli]